MPSGTSDSIDLGSARGIMAHDDGDGRDGWGRGHAVHQRPNGTTEALLVRAHPGLCEGWGECHRWAPDVYPLDEEGTIDIHRMKVPPELAPQAWDGALACPAGVISIVAIVTEVDAEEVTPGR